MFESWIRLLIPLGKRFLGKLPLGLKGLLFPTARLLLNRFENGSRHSAIEENSKATFDLSRIFPDFLPVTPWVPLFHWTFLDEPKFDLTIILPSLRSGSFTAGPMTAMQIAAAASNSMSVRVVGIDRGEYSIPINEIELLLSDSVPNFEFKIAAIQFEVPKHVMTAHINERFMATAWWTMAIAQQGQIVSNNPNPPYYLIQDYEPLLHASSTEGVLAEATYRLPHIPIFNSQPLADFFINFLDGYGEPADQFTIPLPRIDASQLSLKMPNSLNGTLLTGKKTLLFYARPGKAPRNLFEIGIAGIRAAISRGVLLPEEWNFLAVGESIGSHDLGGGATLKSAPWLNYSDYLELVGQSDIYLALMHSPHTGYPIIEAAQLSTLAITSTYANKSASALIEISDSIIPTSPTVRGVIEAIIIAESRLRAGWKSTQSVSHVENPNKWILEFEKWITKGFARTNRSGPSRDTTPAYPRVTLVASIYNIQKDYLLDFLDSVGSALLNTNTEVEALFLDNGSTLYERNYLQDVIKDKIPSSQLLSVEKNLGIIGGMNLLLENSRGEFLVPTDADDILSPDSLSHLIRHIHESPDVDFWYSNEYLLTPKGELLAVEKPNFDEVLITETCFTSHLNCFRKKDAVSLGVYSREDLNGSHDWYTAARFLSEGKKFEHCSEFLYLWRQHPESTSYNWTSKPYVVESQKQVQYEFAKFLTDKEIAVGFNENFPAGPNQRIIEVRPEISILSIKFEAWNPEERHYEFVENQRETILTFTKHNPTGYVWFHLETDQDIKKMIQEISTIISLWPDAIVTGSVFFEFDKSFCPIDRNFPYSEAKFSTFRQIYSKSRRQVLRPNIYSVVISSELIAKSLGRSPCSVEDLILGAVSGDESGSLKFITSPNLDIFSQADYISMDNQEYLQGRHSLRIQTPPAFMLDYSKNQVLCKKYKILENSFPEAPITLLTTLQGSADCDLLRGLAHSILPELGDATTIWTLFVHGEILEELGFFLQELSITRGIRVITDATPHSLHKAMIEAVKHVDTEWILLADYDDLLLPGAISYIRKVTQDSEVGLVVGSELVGTSIAKSKYYNRPIFSRLGLRLFSLFFHPIAVRKRELENLITNKCDYVLDWEILRHHLHNAKIVQIEAPLYFWRAHTRSISNNEFGSNNSKAVVSDVLREYLEESQIPSTEFQISLTSAEPTIVRLHNSPVRVCLKIYGKNRGLGFQALSTWWEKYPYSHYSFLSDLSNLQEDCCQCEYTHFIYDSMRPTIHTSIWDVELLSRMEKGIFGGKNQTSHNWGFSNLRLMPENFNAEGVGFTSLGGSVFNINEHLPMAEINSPTMLFYSNQIKLNFPLKSNAVIYSSKLDFLR